MPRPRTVVDHAVVPAGGHCGRCGEGACPLHRGHLPGCRDGLCAAHCPVRPSQFGYYGTQWRRWPGRGVVPTSATDAATPAVPPTSQVPSAAEESPPSAAEPAAPDAAVPEGDAGDDTAKATPTERPRAEPAREAPASARPVPPTPPGEPPLTPAKTDPVPDLFDRSAVPRAMPEVGLEAGRMRYPAEVTRAVSVGGPPWRLDAAGRQPAADGVRGL